MKGKKGTKSRKVISLIMAFVMIFAAVLPALVSNVKAGGILTITKEAGWLESASVQWRPVEGATEYKVYVKQSNQGDSDYQRLDNLLIRKYAEYYRADAVGLSAGNYIMKVEAILETGSVTATTGTLAVESYDRSGFSFSANSTYKTGSGAYNDDGTLKDKAQVIYITPETAKTVTLDVITSSKGATTNCVGIGAILTARGKGYDTRPLAIRIVGNVKATDMAGQLNSSGYLQVKGKANYAEMNVTVEGIGDDATANGWGILVRYCGNIEVRNLGVMLFPDDGISMDTGNVNVWIHNNDIFYGTAGGDSDQAKGDGSCDLKNDSKYITMSYNHFWDSGKCSLCGMTSETGENYITYHHNWFDHSDSRHPRIRTMTVHIYNNYYDGNSKYGVGVTSGASAFVENNYFRNCKYPMLSSLQGTDNNYGKDGQTFSGENGGIIKSFGNYIVGETRFVDQLYSTTEFDAITVSSRDEKVPATYVTVAGGTTYNNFDTDAAVMYSYNVDTPEQAKNNVEKYAGRVNGGDFKWTFDNEVDDTSYAINAPLMAKIRAYKGSVVAFGGLVKDSTDETTQSTTEGTTQGTTQGTTSDSTKATQGETGTAASGSMVHNFTSSKLESSFYTIVGNMNSSPGTVSYGGLTLTERLKLESATTITFTTTEKSTLVLVFDSDFAKGVKINNTKYTATAGVLRTELAAGTYTITKGDTANLYYMSVVYAEKATESSTQASSEASTEKATESTTQATTEASTQKTTEGTTGSEKTLNVSSNFSEVKTYTESTIVNGFGILASSSASVSVDANKKDSFTHRLKLSGAGSTTARSIQFKTAGASTVTVYAMSSSAGADRTFQVVNANGDVIDKVTNLGGSAIQKVTFTIPSAGMYYVQSLTGGVNVYSISATNAIALTSADLVGETSTEKATEKVTEAPTQAQTQKSTEDSTSKVNDGIGVTDNSLKIDKVSNVTFKDKSGNSVSNADIKIARKESTPSTDIVNKVNQITSDRTQKSVFYYDISAYLNNVSDTNKVNMTNGYIDISMEYPSGVSKNDDIVVLHYSEKISVNKTETGFSFRATGFSPYTVVIMEAVQSGGNDSSDDNDDNVVETVKQTTIESQNIPAATQGVVSSISANDRDVVSAGSEQTITSTSPKTGDNAKVLPLVLLAFISSSAVILISKKSRNINKNTEI